MIEEITPYNPIDSPGHIYNGVRLYSFCDIEDIGFFSFEAKKKPGDTMSYEEIAYVLSCMKPKYKWMALYRYMNKYKMTDETLALAVLRNWHYCTFFGGAIPVFMKISRKVLCEQYGTLELYRKLPDNIKVYRGCNKAETESYEFNPYWSLRRFNAACFAALTINKNAPVICSVTISKKEISAIFENHYEIALFGVSMHRNNVTVTPLRERELSFLEKCQTEALAIKSENIREFLQNKIQEYNKLFEL